MTTDVGRRALLIEGLVIVASILLAFTLDSAAERWAEGERRLSLIEALRSDLIAAQQEVDRVWDMHVSGRNAAAELLASGNTASDRPGEARRVDSLLTAVTQAPSYDAPIGALEALLASGRLDLFPNMELTVALTAFPALVADLNREQELLAGAVRALAENLSVRGVDPSHLNVGTPVPWETAPTGAHRILADPQLRGILNEVYFRYRNTSVDLRSLDTAISRVLTRL